MICGLCSTLCGPACRGLHCSVPDKGKGYCGIVYLKVLSSQFSYTNSQIHIAVTVMSYEDLAM